MITGWDHEESTVLLQRARWGDDAAFSLLYRNIAPLVRRTAHRILRDTHSADDLVQETFYLVLRSLRAGRGPEDSFTGYVLSTVKRLAYRHSSNQKRMMVVDDPAAWESPVASTAQPATAERVATAWAGLPPRWRNILWLIEVEGYSPADLAVSMSMTPNAVSSLATRARQALRQAYLNGGSDD